MPVAPTRSPPRCRPPPPPPPCACALGSRRRGLGDSRRAPRCSRKPSQAHRRGAARREGREEGEGEPHAAASPRGRDGRLRAAALRRGGGGSGLRPPPGRTCPRPAEAAPAPRPGRREREERGNRGAAGAAEELDRSPKLGPRPGRAPAGTCRAGPAWCGGRPAVRGLSLTPVSRAVPLSPLAQRSSSFVSRLVFRLGVAAFPRLSLSGRTSGPTGQSNLSQNGKFSSSEQAFAVHFFLAY